jgi:hypothetical protein
MALHGGRSSPRRFQQRVLLARLGSAAKIRSPPGLAALLAYKQML